MEAVIITVDPEKKRLVLSGRQVERQKREEARKERLAQFKPGDVVEGTVDSLKDYGAFVKLAEGVDGLVHISQISTQRIKHPGAVLKEGQTVKVKILSIADGKISLSMRFWPSRRLRVKSMKPSTIKRPLQPLQAWGIC